MSKQTKKGVVPALRFPEFRDAEAWECRFVKQLVSTVSPPKKLTKDKYQRNGLFPVVDQSQEYICGWSDDTSALIANPTSLIVFGDHTCILKLINQPFVQGADGVKILDVNDLVEIEFLYQCLLFDPVKMEGYKRHYSVLKEKVIHFPNRHIGEQQKIAACLSSLDELVVAHTKKHQALQSYKKGLLQQLFPAEGETQPKLRFPEFEDDGEWISKSLQDVASYQNGKAHEQVICDDGKIVVVNSKFISTEGKVRKHSRVAHCPAEQGDVLMVLSDVPNGKALGKCFFVDSEDTYTVNQRICKLTSRGLDSKMLYYMLNRNSYFLAFDDGVNQTNLKKSDVLNCPLLIPQRPAEQQKIADFLGSVDALITAQAQKIESLKAHKKGLMQQLFPGVDEVDV